MNFPDTRANEIYVFGTVMVAYFMMMHTMMKKDRSDPWAWVTITSCFAVFSLALSTVIGWHPEVTHCTQHCFPWGN